MKRVFVLIVSQITKKNAIADNQLMNVFVLSNIKTPITMILSEKTIKWLQSLQGQEINTIKFLQNWNDKLSSKEFTTIRIFDPKKYKRGDLKRIELKGNFCMYAGIYQVQKVKLYDLSDSQIRQDTGLSRNDAFHWFEKFYGKNYLEKDYSFIYMREVSRDEQLILKMLGHGNLSSMFI